MKKIISFILVIAFVFQFNSISVLAEVLNEKMENDVVVQEGDSTIGSPQINSITANKSSLVAGDLLKISIDVNSNTEIKNVFAGISIGQEWSSYEFKYDENEAKYIYELQITKEMEYKKIYLSTVTVKDINDNSTDFYNNNYLDIIKITDMNGVSDDLSPVFNYIEFDKEEVKIGDTLEILVHSVDDLSGIKRIYGYLKVGNNTEYIEFDPTEITDVYKYTLKVTEEMKYKKIMINYLNISDNADNSTYIYEEALEAVAYVVDEEEKGDRNAPILNNIIFSSDKVKVGETLDVKFDVEDDLSGINSIDISYKIGYEWYSNSINADEYNEYKFQINITEDMLYKNLSFKNITISDNSGNKRIIEENILSNYTVSIVDESGQVDIEEPKINALSVNKYSLIPGEELIISVDASDDVAIANVTGRISIANEYMNNLEFVYNDVNKKYEYIIPITNEMKYKKIKVREIEVTDKSDKRTSIDNYYNDYLDTINITDENGVSDNESPVFNSLTFSNERLKVGDKVDILINVKDELSGIEKIYGYLLIGNESKYVSFGPTDNNDIYKYTLDITEDMKYKKITVNYLYIYDNAGNTRYVWSEQMDAIAKVTDENGFIDENPPVLNNIIFSSNSVKVGDVLEVTFDVKDDFSEVYSIYYMYYYGNTGGGGTLYKNENNEFKLNININDDMVYKKLYFGTVEVSDTVGNINKIPKEQLENYSINIADRNGLVDINLPQLNSVKVNKTPVMPGDELIISVDASDDTGLLSVSGMARIANESKDIDFNYDENTGKYVYKILITEDMKYKKIELNNIILLDNAYNRVVSYNHDNELLDDINITDRNGLMDTEAPIFNDLSFDKNLLKVGDKLNILVNVKEELSGIRSISGNLNIGSYSKYINFEPTENPDIYKYTLTITEDMKYSKIRVNTIYMYDNSGNYTGVYGDEMNSLAKVADENGNFDETNPILKSIRVNKDNIKAGEVLEITLDIEDDLSGVGSVYLGYSIGDQYRPFELVRINEDGEYKLSIEITEDMIYKNIRFNQLNIVDKAGNESIYYHGDLLKYEVRVTDNNGLMDTIAPKLNKFEVSSENPKVGDKFDIYVDATDDLSGIDYINMNIDIEGYYSNFDTNINLVYDTSLKKYKYSFEILEDMQNKNLKFGLYMRDKAGNTSNYDYYSLEIGNITVADKDGFIDIYLPIFNGITISDEKVRPGDEIEISADVADNESGISSVYITYSIFGDEYKDKLMFLEYDSETGKYKGSLVAEEDALYKAYCIKTIQIEDNSNNIRMKMFDNPYKIIVTDESEKVDIDLPIITSISIDKNKAKIGDKIKIEMEASDATSGIKTAKYTYYNGSEYNSIDLKYNTLSKKYEAEIVIDETVKGKILEPASISVSDNVGNITNKYYYDIIDLSIIIDNEEADNKEEIKFLSVNVDKKIAKPGEKVKVSVKASSNKLSVDASFSNEYLTLYYNETNKSYEGFITVQEDDMYKKFTLNYIYLDNDDDMISVDKQIFGDISFVVSDSEGNIDNTKPMLIDYSIYKNNFKLNEEPVIKLEFNDDLSGVQDIEIKIKSVDGSKEYDFNKRVNDKNKKIEYMVLSELKYLLKNEKFLVEEITLTDYAGNKSIYTSNKSDFSKLTFVKGNYLETEKVNIKTDNLHVNDEYLTGSTSLPNVGLRVYYLFTSKIQILEECISDSNGNFKLKLDPNFIYEKYMIEAYDTKTNEVLGYKSLNVNKNVDVTEDGSVDIKDLAEVALHYGQKLEAQGGKTTIIFNKGTIYACDINDDYYIDIFDLILVSKKMSY